MKNFLKITCLSISALFIANSVIGQENTSKSRQEQRQERRTDRQDRRADRGGVGAGAVAGAAVGLALGAVTGDSDIAVAAAAAGAAAGGAYMYDQSREDRRTQMLAESIGGNQADSTSGTQKVETADSAGKRHLQDFIGDWGLNIWVLDTEGNKITATGKAKIVMTAQDVLELTYSNIESSILDQKMSGSSIITYSERSGFSIENKFSTIPGTRKFVGEYRPEKNLYNFYPAYSKDEESLTGVIRSNIRVELRASSNNLVVAETYTMLEGKEVQIQSYRFTK